MEGFLRALGWLGLVGICAVLIVVCVLTLRLHQAFDSVLDHAATAARTAEQRATEAASTMNLVETAVETLRDRKQDATDDDRSRVVAACVRLIQALEGVDAQFDSTRSGLEAAAALIEMANALGLGVEASLAKEATETLDELDNRIAQATDSLVTLTQRLEGNSLGEVAADAALDRAQAAVDSLFSPAARFVDRVQRIGEAVDTLLEKRRADARFWTNSAHFIGCTGSLVLNCTAC